MISAHRSLLRAIFEIARLGVRQPTSTACNVWTFASAHSAPTCTSPPLKPLPLHPSVSFTTAIAALSISDLPVLALASTENPPLLSASAKMEEEFVSGHQHPVTSESVSSLMEQGNQDHLKFGDPNSFELTALSSQKQEEFLFQQASAKETVSTNEQESQQGDIFGASLAISVKDGVKDCNEMKDNNCHVNSDSKTTSESFNNDRSEPALEGGQEAELAAESVEPKISTRNSAMVSSLEETKKQLKHSSHHHRGQSSGSSKHSLGDSRDSHGKEKLLNKDAKELGGHKLSSGTKSSPSSHRGHSKSHGSSKMSSTTGESTRNESSATHGSGSSSKHPAKNSDGVETKKNCEKDEVKKNSDDAKGDHRHHSKSSETKVAPGGKEDLKKKPSNSSSSKSSLKETSSDRTKTSSANGASTKQVSGSLHREHKDVASSSEKPQKSRDEERSTKSRDTAASGKAKDSSKVLKKVEEKRQENSSNKDTHSSKASQKVTRKRQLSDESQSSEDEVAPREPSSLAVKRAKMTALVAQRKKEALDSEANSDSEKPNKEDGVAKPEGRFASSVHPELLTCQQLIYDPCELLCTSKPVAERESAEYGAYDMSLNNRKIKFRVAKITPTKNGQFVTLWKRIRNGPIMPFDTKDPIDLFVVCVREGNNFGQFVFPKSVLASEDVVSRSGKGGKRAIRVYAPWVRAESAQAVKTQNWQIRHFINLSDKNGKFDLARVRKLYAC